MPDPSPTSSVSASAAPASRRAGSQSALAIAHYLPSLHSGLGGPIKVAMDLCAKLASRGHRMTLLTNQVADAPSAWTSADAHDRRLPKVVALAGRVGRFRNLHKDTMRAVEEHLRGHDLLNVHGTWYPANLQVCALAQRLRKPFIYTMHGSIDDVSFAEKYWRKRVFFELCQRAQLARAAAVHCMAQSELEQSGRWFPAGHGVVVPCMVDFAPFRTLPGPAEARAKFPFLARPAPKILCLSRIHPIKCVEVIIDALALLRDRGVDADLVIAGGTTRDRAVKLINGMDPYLHELHQRVARLKLEDRVCFTGAVSGSAKVSLYQACDVFAMASLHENFGLVFLEALAAGLPLVTTKGAGLWPELQRSGAAAIVDHAPTAFAEAFATWLRNPQRAKLGQQGRAWALETFDDEKVANQYEQMYAQAIAGRFPGGDRNVRITAPSPA